MIEHILTVDLEDWFHCLAPDPTTWNRFERRVDRVTRQLLDILDEHHARATFFVLGDVAQHHAGLVREIASRGHEIGSHGTRHALITTQSRADFRDDVRESLERLADMVGHKIEAFRAPYFSVTKATTWALDILVEEGIRRDSSIFPVRNHRYGIPDAPTMPHQIRPGLTEFPISVFATSFGNLPFAGGVYFRWLPMLWIEHAFSTFEARAERVVFYLHPWELDPGHPRHYAGSPFLHLRHYGRLAPTEARLRRLLERHRFTSLAMVSS